MSFSSPGFVFAFLPAFFVLYFLIPHSMRNGFLMFASLAFYSADGGYVTLVLILSIIGNHIIGNWIERTGGARARIWILAFGVVLNLVPLLYCKYFGFFLHMVSDVGVGAPNPASFPFLAVLPAGISFFTFQGLSYIVDIYRRETKPAPTGIDFGMYHSLFPQLIAGPIVRYREVEDRIVRRPVSVDDVEYGIIRFCIGLAKKIILADNMGVVADRIFSLGPAELSMTAAWVGIAAYTLQIFFDFSGYSDMAIGLGRALGFRFPENFDQPYRSLSITEFWRRWHMTLSRWFRDYVYIPLGGNRAGPFRTYANLFIVFVLCGLWHGAAYTFLIWGIYHGALLVIERVNRSAIGISLPPVLSWPVTLLLVMIGWVLFRATDMVHAARFLRAMGGFGASDVSFNLAALVTSDKLFFFVAAAVLSLWPASFVGIGAGITRVVQQMAALAIFVYSMSLIATNGFNPFIYFRFQGMSARLFIAIFFLLTVLPFAQMVTRAIPGDAINENRNLAKRPDLSKGIEHFPRLANEWFNDHFGLRALLIKFKTQIDFSVFGTSDKVVVGRNGWLFYRAVISKEEPLVERLLSQGLEDRIVNGVRNFTDALQAAGIRSVFTINMMSDRFYGDQLPSWVAPRPQRPRIDHLVDRLRALPNVTFVDSTAILRETMKSRQVFFKTDFHWNDPGAFPVAKDIVDKISSAEGLQASLWSHKLETTTETFSGGIATFMPLFSSPSEQALKVKPNFKDPPGARRRYDVGVFEKVMTSDGASPAYLPQTVVVGDSFFDGLEKSGIESYFSGLSRARWRPGVKLSVVAEQMPDNTKWVIVQFIETSTHAMDALADAADVQKAVQIIKQRTARPEQNTR